MNEPWVAIQRNPRSGSGRRRRLLHELISGLRRRGIVPRLFSDRARLAERLAEQSWRERLVCIVAAGGDGTVADVVNRHPGARVAVLPLGTENLMARYLKIPACGDFVAGMIAGGRTHRFDLGLLEKVESPESRVQSQKGPPAAGCSGSGLSTLDSGPFQRRFLLLASAGFDAEVVRGVHDRRRGHIGKWSYVQPLLSTWRSYDYPELRLFVDGGATPVTARLAMVLNVPAYALGLRIAASARGDDGRFDLRLFGGGSTFQMLRYLYKVAAGSHEGLADVRSLRTERVRIESDVPVPIQIDGDPCGWTPVEISVLPGALEMFVPERW